MTIEISSKDYNPFSLKYKIPDEIKEKIPVEFYIALAGEITSVFGLKVWDKYDDGSPYEWIAGTSGLEYAIRETCEKLGLNWLWGYYESLRWYESDQFDDVVVLLAKQNLDRLSKGSNPNEYHRYLVEKAW